MAGAVAAETRGVAADDRKAARGAALGQGTAPVGSARYTPAFTQRKYFQNTGFYFIYLRA